MKSLLIFTIFLLPFISGCKSSARKDYEKAVKEWTGKTILFPDSMQSVSGKFLNPPQSDFTIVAYFDSIGCTACRMKLPYWIEFMNKVESIYTQSNVSLLMVAETNNQNELEQLIKRYDFPYQICIDYDSRFSRLNQLPKMPELQTFLLNKNHKVIAIGNPTFSSAIKNLYLDHLFANKKLYKADEEMVYEYEVGAIKSNQEIKHTFNMCNYTSDTLKVAKLLTSCECITGTLSESIIPPEKHIL